MKQPIDIIMANVPIILLVIIFGCLIYSEFSEISICISWDKVMELLNGVVVGHQVKVLG
jgi:hypothetical protein